MKDSRQDSPVLTTSEHPKVSIIMPSLNVGQYIEQCLTSVITQTLREIEILCIDAGSTDGTLDTIEAFASKDSRIKVIHSPVKSYGAQINQGLDVATGDYIGIVETDDWVEPEMFATLVEAAERYDGEIVKSDHIREYGTHSEYSSLVPFDRNLYERVLSPTKEWRVFRFQMMNWTGIFRRDLLERYGVRCNETPGASYQDNGFWFSSLAVTERFIAIPHAFYHYRLNNANQSVAFVNKSHSIREEFEFIRTFLKRNNRFEQVRASYYTTLLGTALWLLNKIVPEKRVEVAEWIRNICSSELGLQNEIPKEHFLLERLFDWELSDLIPLIRSVTADAFLLTRFGRDWKAYGEEGRIAYIARFVDRLLNQHEDRLQPLYDAMCHVDFEHEDQALDFFRKIAPLLPKRRGPVRNVGLYYHRLYDGGTERVLTLVAKLLHNHGYEIVLITDEPPSPKDYSTARDFTREVFPPEARLFRTPIDLSSRAIFWKQVVNTRNLDTVCYLGRWASTRAFDLLALRCIGVNAVMCDHNASYAALVYGDVNMFLNDPVVFALADVVASLSRGEAAYWKACGVRSAYVPNPPVFHLNPLPPTQRKTVLWLGRIARCQKRPLDALKAIDLVRRKVPDVILTILGDGPDMEELKRFSRENDLERNVRFLGFHEDVSPYFDDTRLHLLTSSYESWSLVWAEAKSKGIPTVMYEMPGLELARRSEGFLAVPMGDYRALADAIISVLKSDDVYTHLRTSCIRTAEEIGEDEVFQAWKTMFSHLEQEEWPQASAIPSKDVMAMVAMLRLGIQGQLTHRFAVSTPEPLASSAELSAFRELAQHRLVRVAIDFDTWTRRAFPPGNTPIRRFAKKCWSIGMQIRKGCGRVVKQFVPYGMMRVWLKVRYDISLDAPSSIHTRPFHRFMASILPYGLVIFWRKWRNK